MTLAVDYSDLTYDPAQEFYPVFHDGNGDGRYTAVEDPVRGLPTPDLNLDGVLDLTEDFPVDTYPIDETLVAYLRPVTHALAELDVFEGNWPEEIAIPDEAAAYWNLREAVRLYQQGLAVRDHVQAIPGKPHVHQAFDRWNDNGAWVQINPSPNYMREADSRLASRNDLPDNAPNTAPIDWTDHAAYAVPEDIPKPIYQLAAIYQMADAVHGATASRDPITSATFPAAATTGGGAMLPRSLLRGSSLVAVWIVSKGRYSGSSQKPNRYSITPIEGDLDNTHQVC